MDELKVEDLRRLRNNARGRIIDWVQKGKDASSIIGDYWKYENELRNRGVYKKHEVGGRAEYLNENYWVEWRKTHQPQSQAPNKCPASAQQVPISPNKERKNPLRVPSKKQDISKDKRSDTQSITGPQSKKDINFYYILYIVWSEYKEEFDNDVINVVDNINSYLKHLKLKTIHMDSTEFNNRKEYSTEYKFEGTQNELDIIKDSIRYIINRHIENKRDKIDIYSKKIT